MSDKTKTIFISILLFLGVATCLGEYDEIKKLHAIVDHQTSIIEGLKTPCKFDPPKQFRT